MIGLGYEERRLAAEEWRGLIDRWLEANEPGARVLIVPPDYSRCYSYAGELTAYLYGRLSGTHTVRVLPAVGTHMQMTREEKAAFFPGVPEEAFLEHSWRTDTVSLGCVPGAFISEATGGRYQGDVEVQVDRRLVSGEFDTILSVGQVVPHEVVGFANYTKNLLVGLGGREMINRSHMVSAMCGIERCMGNVDTPARAIFDYAQRTYLDRLGVTFLLTVTTERRSAAELHGLYIGAGRDAFEAAAALSARVNVTWLDERVPRVVAYLDPAEFRSTWVGNKAIYRTRMAIADGGELTVIAPGLRQFGENEEVDRGIRRYGYCGTEKIMRLYREGAFEGLEMIAAHLIHGSSESRFTITYATDPTLIGREAVEGVGFRWMNAAEALERYRPGEKETGVYADGDGAYYFVKTPSVGLWRTR